MTDHRTVVEFVDHGPRRMHKTHQVRVNGSPVTVAVGGIIVTNPSGENPLRVMLTLLPDELHYVHDAETPPSAPPAAPVAAQEPDQAPVDPQGATGPQKGAGRIGWLRTYSTHPYRFLAREVEGGWSDGDCDALDWSDTDWPNAVFTPLLPGFFVAPDSNGVPTIWRETDGSPVRALRRPRYSAAFFDAVAGLLETREEA